MKKGTRYVSGEEAVKLTMEAVHDGCLLELGWLSFANLYIPEDAPPDQMFMMHLAFMSGAQHLYAAIYHTQSSDDSVLSNLPQVHKELDDWRQKLLLLNTSNTPH